MKEQNKVRYINKTRKEKVLKEKKKETVCVELEQVLLRFPLKGRRLISAPGVGGFQDLSGKTSQIQRQDVPRHSRAANQEMSCTFVDVVDITWRG